MPPPSSVSSRRISLKGAAVALILAMHGLGLYFLLLPARQLKHDTEVAFMTLMPPRPLPRTLPMPSLPLAVTAPSRKGRSLPPASVPVPAPLVTAAPAAAISTAPEPIAADELPAAPADDLRSRARMAAGSIDKTLRAELKNDKPWLAAPELKSGSKFSALVASAWRGGPPIRLEEYMTANGRPATRVITATGAACYAIQANPLAGADPFNTAGKVKQVPCP
ncbi:hypothetical protein [Janthinobacterium sp. RB2R34]|uniref:hypothetical protein n=1 Tax=Janthinobacterium sp. RB2R34 TaxID=3424193 RepID=UPI003F2868B7